MKTPYQYLVFYYGICAKVDHIGAMSVVTTERM